MGVHFPIHGAGGGGGGCFTGSTLISTPGGSRRIDELKAGDIVYSFDDAGAIKEKEIIAVHCHENEQVFRYKIWGGSFLDATPNHWVLNQYNAFVCIGGLNSDDCLVDESEHLRPIVGKEDLGLHTVYNLTVKGCHTFIADGIRVHNAGLGAGSIHGAGGGGCFTGETLVCTPEGSVRIDSLKAGDIVYSFDDHGEIKEGEVIAVHYHKSEQVFKYKLWGGTYLEATPNHWVLNQYNAFVCIGELGDDDCVVDENDHLRPITGREDIGFHPVYNLTVKGFHTFFAGGVRVHNAGLGGGLIHGAIRGEGGGGGGGKGKGGGKKPRTDPDSLNSEARASIIDVLGEGEIEGFPSAKQYSKTDQAYYAAALKDVYFDKTQVLKSTANPESVSQSDFNFKIADAAVRFGTNDQTYVPGFSNIENEQAVNVVVSEAYPVTRTITDTDVDAIRLTINFPSLQRFTDKGDILATSVRYQIIITGLNQSPVVAEDVTVEGRTGDLYQKSHTINLAGYAFPIEVAVKRITSDSSNTKVQNAFGWASYTEITYGKLRYPNTAYIALSLNARDFSSIPTRTYRIRGLKVSIPNNATVDSENGRLLYSGLWDGEFANAQWTTDPAWILWDMLTNTRYGAGSFILQEYLDRFSFYQASQYCSELVPDGKGGQEPRFSCNVVIRNQDDAYKVINSLCSVFRAMPYWSAGALMISQDRPTDASYLFNDTNILEGGFQYSGSSLKTRHSVAIVSWFDMEQQDIVYEAVEDQAAIPKYGANTVQVEGFACTSQGQARRLGEWILYTEQYETEVISFKTALDAGPLLTPGCVIGVMDKLRSGVRRGGRIVSSSTTTILVDETLATDLPLTGSPSILVQMADGTTESRPVASVSNGKITVTTPFSAAPLIGGAFIYSNDSQGVTYWRVISVKEEDRSAYTVNAVSYNASKYDYVERGANLIRKTYLPIEIEELDPPASITTSAISVLENGAITNRVFVSWPAVPDAAYYVVNYRPIDTAAWIGEETSAPVIEFNSARTGGYELQIATVNAVGRSSSPSSFEFSIDPSSLPMQDVSNVTATINSPTLVTLSWSPATRAYILVGGSVIIKHQAVASNATWGDATTIISLSGSSTSAQVPLITGTYLLRFQSSSGSLSENTTTIYVSAPAVNTSTAFTFNEHLTVPPFNGTKAGMRYDEEDAGLLLEGGVFIDDIGVGGDWDTFNTVDGLTSLIDLWQANIDELGDIDTYPEIDTVASSGGWDSIESVDLVYGGANSGEYYFDLGGSPVDLGGNFNVYVNRTLEVQGYLLISDIDVRSDLIDTWTDFDGVISELGDASVQMRISSDGIVFTEWTNFINSSINARFLEFRLIASTTSSAESVLVKQLGASIQLPERTETKTVNGNGAVLFQDAFYTIPSIVISGNNAQSGDYYQVTSLTRTGMTVTWYNSSNSPVSRTFNYQATGYGTEIV
jgi:predicted phage tail protein